MPTMRTYDGTEVEVEHLQPQDEAGARLDVEHPDGRRWRLDVDHEGNPEVVTTWRDGELADLKIPEWLEDNLARHATPLP